MSLKSKLKDASNVHANTPGPGAYKPVSSLPQNGVNFYSKFKSVNSGFINSKETRFSSTGRKVAGVPGPGQYSPKTEMANTGSNFLSRFKSSGTLSLYKSNRDTMKLPKSDRYGPGPGSYILPSDFGYPTLSKMMKTKKHSGARSSSQL